MNGWWDKLFKFWPLIVLGIPALGGAVWYVLGLERQVDDLRNEIRSMQTNRQAESRQWQLINENSKVVIRHEERLVEIEKHITVEAVQRWGQIQRMVEEDHRDLKGHLRTHNGGGQ